MLQPDLNPYTEKYEKDSLEIVKDLLTISEKYGKGKVDFYIAPETAFPGKGGISENGFQYSLMINKIKNLLHKNRNRLSYPGFRLTEFMKTPKKNPKLLLWIVREAFGWTAITPLSK